MFKFFKRKADVLNHWIAFVDGFELSPSEFYADVERELAVRCVPRLEMARIDFAEGGLLSEKRIYLRMLRERIVFDVCAAPFGKGFFFSCRTAEIPIVLQIGQLLLLFLSSLFAISIAIYFMAGSYRAFFFGFAVLAMSAYLMRKTAAMGMQDLDRALAQSQLIGSIYEVFFRRKTYYRLDSQLCFVHVVPTIVKRLAEEATAEKGIKLIDQFEQTPILGELYRPSKASFPNPVSQPPIIR